ncbi:PI4KA lipid kinase complex subunit hyccin [Dermatophagoides pteronyssinus]|uniref:PI4KA lipid kinase complex subunit hyccin n=1 Tax=Dermatophagoides pteronyssinus TaxID=6956 RepID=UPI003F681EE4
MINCNTTNNNNNNIIKSSSINDRKRTLIEDFIQSNDDNIKIIQIDDHAIEAIFDLLEHPERDVELFISITKRLYNIYKTQDRELRLKTIIFLPTLIAVYIRYHHQNYHHHQHCLATTNNDNDDQQKQQPNSEPKSSIAILLMCIYNFEIINQKTGDLKTIDIRLISLSKPSIYHEQSAHTSGQVSIPTEQMLAKINNPQESKITIFGPYHEVEHLNTGNQQSIFTVLMKLYNQHIEQCGYYSWQSMLRLYLDLLKQGSLLKRNCYELKQQIKSILQNNTASSNRINSKDNIIPESSIQIQFTSEFLTELMKSSYFCFHNDLEDLSAELIEEICKRSTYKFYGDVILMVNAFKNTQAIINRDRENHRAKMKRMNQSEISLNTTPHVTTITSVSSRKTAITNASFKTKKLPDDIPIVPVGQPAAAAAANLNAQQAHHSKNSLQQHPKQNGRPSFKSLDSINEETSSSSPILPSGKLNTSKSSSSSSSSSKPQRKSGVMNMLKELKESSKQTKNKSSKLLSSMETNGKISNTNHNQEEFIQMKQMKKPKKFIDNDNNDDGDQIDQTNDIDSINMLGLNPPLAPLERFTDDDDDDDDGDNDDNKSGEAMISGGHHSNERFTKLRINEINDHNNSSSDLQSDRSSGSSAVALLGMNLNQQQQQQQNSQQNGQQNNNNNSTATNSSSMIKSSS